MSPCREPSPGPSGMDMICQCNKLKPPKIEGGVEPLKYEESFEGWRTYLKLWTTQLGLSWPWSLINLSKRPNSGAKQLNPDEMNPQ